MSDRAITTDLLVVGLGPAGSRAARAAAEGGLSVIAIDRRSRPGFPVQCAEFIPALMEQEIAGLDGVTRQFIDTMATFVERKRPTCAKISAAAWWIAANSTDCLSKAA